MGAPKGNQFWKLRSKHGQDKLFASPKLLLDAAYEYFAWCDENPWMKKEQVKKPYEKKQGRGKVLVTMVDIPTQRPYSLSGLGIYCHVSERFILDFEKRLQEKGDEEAKGFLAVTTHIREVISTQQLEGATVGAFNANIVARKLGLTDKKDITTDGESLNKGYYDLLKQRKMKQSNQQ
ncbi:terminase small subunit [Cnuella takakiae]|nr:terminase small subunit [Cnuella takakiae]OLY92493.1 hypothetical protein BUE76_11790 [Cnuella takakiae]